MQKLQRFRAPTRPHALIAVIGIGFFALPAGVLSAACAEQIVKRKEPRVRRCPHCGRDVE